MFFDFLSFKRKARVLSVVVFCGLSVLPFGNLAPLSSLSAKSRSDLPVIKSQPIEIQKVYPSGNYFHPNLYKYKGEISYSEMKEDLENLKYLLETCYAGLEIAESRGLDLEKSVQNILKKFEGAQTVYSRDFAKAIQDELWGKVIDAHFVIYTGNFPSQWLGFSEHENVYLSDYFVSTENAEVFRVENSEVQLLPYYHDGVLSYRVGVLSVQPVQKISVKIGGKATELPVKNYPVNNPSGFPYLKEKSTSSTAYIRLESFLDMNTKASEKTFEKFCSAGSRYRTKPNVILDLRTNQGGSHDYEELFIESFYYNDSVFEDKAQNELATYIFSRKIDEIYDGCFRHFSYAVAKNMYDLNYGIKLFKKEKKEKMLPEDVQDLKDFTSMLKKQEKNPEKNWSKIYFCEEPSGNAKKVEAFKKAYENYKSAFSGRMIILLDRNSCSASEEICVLAKEFFGKENVILVGENSGGCIEYGATCNFYLPNSELTFHIPTSICAPFMERLDSWHGEGNGIYPDIWSTDDDMTETLVNITKDEALREK